MFITLSYKELKIMMGAKDTSPKWATAALHSVCCWGYGITLAGVLLLLFALSHTLCLP